MNPRVRKLVGLVAIMVFLAAYVMIMSKIGDLVPKFWAAQMAYYVVAGIGWGLPILPLISWMNTGRWR